MNNFEFFMDVLFYDENFGFQRLIWNFKFNLGELQVQKMGLQEHNIQYTTGVVIWIALGTQCE